MARDLVAPAGERHCADALLRPAMRQGRRVEGLPNLAETRDYAKMQLLRLPPALAELKPVRYPVEIARLCANWRRGSIGNRGPDSQGISRRCRYLVVEPLTWHRGRGLAIGGNGRVVDWLVKMVRLPAAHMLDRRIADGDLRIGDVHGLAERLAAFFADAPPAHMPPPAYRDRFRDEVRVTRAAFDAYASPRQQAEATRIARRIEAFITCRNPLLQQRRAHLVEGHGDLRPEHVCLGSTPRIIDCLEFRADLRWLDPLQEIAFLAMECARLGAPAAIERILFGHYVNRTDDAPSPVLIDFYKAIGAFIRARIAILHLQDAPVRDPAKWPKRAAEYLAIAARHGMRLTARR